MRRQWIRPLAGILLGMGCGLLQTAYTADDIFYTQDGITFTDEQKHVVQPGEDLSHIAKMYGIPAPLLAHHNSIGDPDDVMVGQVIYLPGDEYPAELLLPEEPTAAESNPLAMNAPSEMTMTESGSQSQSTQSLNTQDSGFNSKPYAYFGNGEPVADVIRNFASNYSIPVVMSEYVDGIVNGKIGPLPSVDFLDKLAQLNNLIWYFDGNTLYVYNSQEIQKQIINLQFLSAEEFRQTLIDIGIWDNRFYWRAKPEEGLIYLSGPPRYMELVTQTASLLDEKAGARQKNRLTVRVFPLKYAWADDRKFSFRSQQVTIPGVASVLNQIVQGGGINTSSIPSQSMEGMSPATPVGGARAPANAPQQPNPQVQAENVFINADRRLNAVIIHDLETKMPMYESLINTLDKPLAQVEINVSIIDINTESLDRLGVNWKLTLDKQKNNFIEFNPFESGADLSNTFSTIIQNTGGKLFSQVNLLTTQGNAKVLARPSVLTLDNMEAVLDNSQTFYVQVAGRDDAQLFPVTYGSVLKVTPRIVDEISGRKIHLSVNIQDGGQDSSASPVQNIPVVKNSSISTQAVIEENESLLIGGYYYETSSNDISKVPVLGDMPIVGVAFRNKTKETKKTVRLFLITPRIVNLM